MDELTSRLCYVEKKATKGQILHDSFKWSIYLKQSESQKHGCQGQGGGEKLVFNGYRISVLQDKKVLEVRCMVMWIYLIVLLYTGNG